MGNRFGLLIVMTIILTLGMMQVYIQYQVSQKVEPLVIPNKIEVQQTDIEQGEISQSLIAMEEPQQINRGTVSRSMVNLTVPSETKGEFKAYMDYRCITDKSSQQYQLQQQAYTDENGFRRIGEDYMIAIGGYYSKTVGERLQIKLDNGITFTAIVSDLKKADHTDSTQRYVEENGNIIEFIIDDNSMNDLALEMGDVSFAGLEGGIISIERIVE